MKMLLCYACGCLCTTASYLSASFGDPGLLSAWEAISGDLEAEPRCTLVHRGSREVGEQQIECDCGRPHPPRSCRCRHCKQCVLRYDHHCHALNQCVGLGNIGSFLTFCWSLFCCQCMTLRILRADNPDAAAEFICLALASDITGVKTSQQNQTTDTRGRIIIGSASSPGGCLAALGIAVRGCLAITLLMAVPVGVLACFHGYLATSDLTSGEFKRLIDDRLRVRAHKHQQRSGGEEPIPASPGEAAAGPPELAAQRRREFAAECERCHRMRAFCTCGVLHPEKTDGNKSPLDRRAREGSDACCGMLCVAGGLWVAVRGALRCCVWRVDNAAWLCFPVARARCRGDWRSRALIRYDWMRRASKVMGARADVVQELQMCLDLDFGACVPADG